MSSSQNNLPLPRTKKIQNMLNKTFPKKKFFCVYSPELLSNKGENSTEKDA